MIERATSAESEPTKRTAVLSPPVISKSSAAGTCSGPASQDRATKSSPGGVSARSRRHHHRVHATPSSASRARHARSSAWSANHTAWAPAGTCAQAGRTAPAKARSSAARQARSQTGEHCGTDSAIARGNGSANERTYSQAAAGNPLGRRSAPASVCSSRSRAVLGSSAVPRTRTRSTTVPALVFTRMRPVDGARPRWRSAGRCDFRNRRTPGRG